MKSKEIHDHFTKLKQQRKDFYNSSYVNLDRAWSRPFPEKWSIGETLYHLVLMIRLFRRFSSVYIPILLPVAHVRKKRGYKIEMHNIYETYHQDHKKAMNAPFLIKPPAGLEEKWSINDVQSLLEHETDKLMANLDNIEQDLAGQIYYPDPVAEYPNLIQCIHLLAIHEQHHFKLTKKYLAS
ncbi:DinB family protein [Salicibibacter kimchii]|uniref:DinB family protein n=1 Tax=Salicibibacter kimchii TaxID=2099786 RepID=UPI001358FCDC|nr:DinB family protein [Salicibibacter kimchii]